MVYHPDTHGNNRCGVLLAHELHPVLRQLLYLLTESLVRSNRPLAANGEVC